MPSYRTDFLYTNFLSFYFFLFKFLSFSDKIPQTRSLNYDSVAKNFSRKLLRSRGSFIFFFVYTFSFQK